MNPYASYGASTSKDQASPTVPQGSENPLTAAPSMPLDAPRDAVCNAVCNAIMLPAGIVEAEVQAMIGAAYLTDPARAEAIAAEWRARLDADAWAERREVLAPAVVAIGEARRVLRRG